MPQKRISSSNRWFSTGKPRSSDGSWLTQCQWHESLEWNISQIFTKGKWLYRENTTSPFEILFFGFKCHLDKNWQVLVVCLSVRVVWYVHTCWLPTRPVVQNMAQIMLWFTVFSTKIISCNLILNPWNEWGVVLYTPLQKMFCVFRACRACWAGSLDQPTRARPWCSAGTGRSTATTEDLFNTLETWFFARKSRV